MRGFVGYGRQKQYMSHKMTACGSLAKRYNLAIYCIFHKKLVGYPGWPPKIRFCPALR